MLAFFQDICQNEWGDTYKIRKITQNMYSPVPGRRDIILF